MNVEKLQTLKEGVAKLPKGDQGFAASLLEQFTRKGELSEKQWFWVGKLATQIGSAPDPEAVVVPPAGAGPYAAINALFDKASKYLKWPKVALTTAEWGTVQFARAGASSSMPGSITLTDGGHYGASKFYGRITKEGEFTPSPAGAKPEIAKAIVGLLTVFAAAPAEVVAEQGKFKGRCVFCLSELTNERSLTHGYGRVCAQRWGMPWSDTSH